MTASLHKLTAGSGYDYLTRQVAVQDSTEKGHASLASYYSEKGETPGTWVGSGLAGLGDVAVGDVVTAEQMKALFGAGFHPNMAARLAGLPVDASREQVRLASRLGTPFKVNSGATEFQRQVAVRCTSWLGEHPDAGEVPVDVRAEFRNDVARGLFVERLGRVPSGFELAGEVARLSRDPSTACAGFDVTFTPVKSVSALWALAPVGLAARIEQAHHAAVADALAFMEHRVLSTRAGAGGVRQLDVTGMVAAAFVHRDSRAGDPNLHTHVAIANKVQTLDGRWLAIDGRWMFKALVAVSETYNTQLEAHLAALGIRFQPRPGDDPTKRPVREVVGVPAALVERWSSRRAAITARQQQLAAGFQRVHGRPPTPVEALKLAQQATLETRDAKHEARSIDQQRTAWLREAVDVVGGQGIEAMIADTIGPVAAGWGVGEEWLVPMAGEVVATVGSSRATWQVWHLRAEASRRVRDLRLDPAEAEAVTERLLGCAVSLSQPVGDLGWDKVAEPSVLRRRDGSSVYWTAGEQLYTSRRVVAAEASVLELAGRTGGVAASGEQVGLALLEAAANGVELNAGQANLVREMATSGRLVQLGLAAAGSGKTTALAVLGAAWRETGNRVVGLAPSAVAAGVLRDQLGQADTIAQLVTDLTAGRSTPLTGVLGPGLMVIIDEAGMADTASLAYVTEQVTARGGVVRLIGDDQQLAAISAGGVLRDIAHTHGAIELHELVRFTDPAEAAASLALRQGHVEALGFYLDHDRIHPGTADTSLETALGDWVGDVASGRDALLMAATRETVAELNRRARDHLLTTRPEPAGRVVVLADGNEASVGDVVITRMNDRRLRVSATDWVKNGDRWIIEGIDDDGTLRARHRSHGLHTRLPVDYYSRHLRLGYACTIHSAQGLTVDVTRGVISGAETRQQLYVMATRGRTGNHVYVPVVGDGDEHSLPRPETLRPETAVDVLEQILARDGAARSATTQARDQHDPRLRLGQAVARYVDALGVAAETITPPGRLLALDASADDICRDITQAPAWPVLRSMLILQAVDGPDPITVLRDAVGMGELNTAHDPAAVLTWRIGDPNTPAGPLPWLPAVPDTLAAHTGWGPYLERRASLVEDLAGQVRQHLPERPVWVLPGQHVTPSLVAEVEVWRAANDVAADDRRPTGPARLGARPAWWQRQLDQRTRAHIPQVWSELLVGIDPAIGSDPFTPVLAARIAALHNLNVPITAFLAEAVADGPLPADQPSAALWWRLTSRLSHDQHTQATTAAPDWVGRFEQHLGPARAAALQASPSWPALAATIDQALAVGAPLEQLLNTEGMDVTAFDDETQALTWRIRQLTSPPPADDAEPPHPDELAPEGIEHATRHRGEDLDVLLGLKAIARDNTPPDHTAIELRRDFDNADRQQDSPWPLSRLAEINELTSAFYQRNFPDSWAHTYLAERLGQDLTDDDRYRPGHAPAGWTRLVNHLHTLGVEDPEMLATGVATRTRNGNLIDKFRDRLIFPITADDTIVGFVARRHPDHNDDDKAGPKYLNTATTALFSKRHVLYGRDQLQPHHFPVIVEGPVDAIAITLAGRGQFIGVAPLGTALTPEQILTLPGRLDPVIATDGDLAGTIAAENAYWQLAAHRYDPYRLQIPTGTDPADLLHHQGPDALFHLLNTADRQADHMTTERLLHLPAADAAQQITQIQAARPPRNWQGLPARLSRLADIPDTLATERVLDAIDPWTSDPHRAGEQAQGQSRQLRQRLQAPPVDRWSAWMGSINPAVVDRPEWPELAARLDEVPPDRLLDPRLQTLLRQPTLHQARDLLAQDNTNAQPSRPSLHVAARYPDVSHAPARHRSVTPAARGERSLL